MQNTPRNPSRFVACAGQEPVWVRGPQCFHLAVIRERQGKHEEFFSRKREAKTVEQQCRWWRLDHAGLRCFLTFKGCAHAVFCSCSWVRWSGHRRSWFGSMVVAARGPRRGTGTRDWLMWEV